MKIEIYFRDEKIGEGVSNGDDVQWTGKGPLQVGLVQYYAEEGYKGDELLKVLLRKLRGNCWAREVPE